MKRLNIDTNLFYYYLVEQQLSGSCSCYLCVTEGDFLFPLCMFSSFVILPPYCLDAVRLSGINFGKQKAYRWVESTNVLSLVTQPMLQCRPYCMELRSMDSYIQVLCRFQKCKRIAPQLSLLNNEKSRNAKLGFKDL